MENQKNNEKQQVDPALGTFGEHIEALGKVQDELRDDVAGVSMNIEKLSLNMPVELDVYVQDDGSVVIGSAPPTQIVETTEMPVFHQLKVTFGSEK